MERRADHPSDSIRVYHCNQELTGRVVAAERGSIAAEGKDDTTPAILYRLLEIRGVMAAEVHVYHVVIHKAPMFEWEAVEKQVWELLDCFNLGEGNLMLELDTDDCDPVDIGKGFRIIFQRDETSPNLVRAALEHEGRVIWQDGTINHKTFTREQHLNRVRMLLANAGLPDGVTI